MRIRPILFYDERETNDRSLTTLNFKTKKKKNWKRKISILKKKGFSCEFDLFICCTYYTYIHTWYLLLYIYEVVLSIISLSQPPPLRVLFVFPPNEMSERKRKVRAKKKKEEVQSEDILFIFYLPYLGTLVFPFFFFLFFFKKILYTDTQVHVGTYLPYTLL